MKNFLITIRRDLAPTLLYLLDRGEQVAQSEDLAELTREQVRMVRHNIEEQIAEAIINP